MLTVWSMCTGRAYAPQCVNVLLRMVERNLRVPFEFICIADREIPGIDTIAPINDLPGWWGKTNLFSQYVSRARNLWLDLDVVITGKLDGLVEPLQGSDIRIIKNWAQSGWGGCQSSVMYWEGQSAKIIHDEFNPAIAYWPPINKPGVLWGDQEHITVCRDAGKIDVEYFDKRDIVSFKYHCRNGKPDEAKIVVFHGDPKPGQVSGVGWVAESMRNVNGHVC